VCVGDRYRIGETLFEVTQPRVTCYRVGIRMNEAQMAALLTSSGKPGFYFRVLQEGEVEAGDEIVKVADGPEHMTVAEINALLYLPGHSRQQLERAPHSGAERRLANILSSVPPARVKWRSNDRESGARPELGSPPHGRAFAPQGISDSPESSSVLSLVLVPADGRPLVAASLASSSSCACGRNRMRHRCAQLLTL
jgi:hypothetical protein